MFGQSSRRQNVLLLVVFAVYVVLLLVVAWRHEPWFDEAQAWLLARDAGFVELLTERLRYEGTPGLWHLLLVVPAKLGLPFWTMTVISVVLASATVYLFLRYSPFSLYVKALFPFGFFTFYQYAVVARSYTLMALLTVSIAVVFHERNKRPVLFFVLLALLANVNVHGFIIAGCLTLYHLWRLWPQRSALPARILRRHVIGAAALGAMALLVVVQLLPPDDLGFPARGSRLHRLWILLDAFTLSRPLSCLLLGLSTVWFWRQRLLFVWAASTAGLALLFAFAWASVWHEGVLYYLWIFCAWLSVERTSAGCPESGKAAPLRATRYVEIAVLVVLGWHVHWAVVCSSRDVAGAYSGSREAYAYLVRHRLQEREIYAHGFSTISVLPYFAENVFDNYNGKRDPSYFLWAEGNPLLKPRESLLGNMPEFILVGIKNDRDRGLDFPDYRLIRRFEGDLFWKHGILEPDRFLLYQRRDGRPVESRLAGPSTAGGQLRD